MPKVSVIIPLYNAAPYVPNLKQLWEQTLQDFELILVDDCSSDDTWDQLQAFQEQNPGRAIILARNDQNQGPGGSRNHGLTKSSGKYVIFLDCDDRYDPTLLEKMAQRLDATQADLVCCGFTAHKPTHDQDILFPAELNDAVAKFNAASSIKQLDAQTLSALVLRPSISSYPFNKMVRRNFLVSQHIAFPSDVLLGEDDCWMVDLVLSAHSSKLKSHDSEPKAQSSLELINEVLYHYIARSNSISSDCTIRTVNSFFNRYENQFQAYHAAEVLEQIATVWQLHVWDTFFNNYKKLSAHPELQTELISRALTFFQSHNLPTAPQAIAWIWRHQGYKLIPKLPALMSLRNKCKDLYYWARFLRDFQKLLEHTPSLPPVSAK